MKEYVVGFFFARGEVLLILKNRPEWQKGKLNGVGGKIEDGETPAQAMVREFKEETGRDTVETDWLLNVIMHGAQDNVYFFAAFQADRFGPDGSGDEPCLWFDPEDLPHNVLFNLRWLIPLCWDDEMVKPIEATQNV